MDRIKKWFGAGEKKSEEAGQAYKSELEDDIVNRDDFLKWSDKKGILADFLKDLRTEYGKYLTESEEHEEWVDFLRSQGADGFMVHTQKYPGTLSKWIYLAEYLKDQTMSWGYKLYSSEEGSDGGDAPVTYLRYYFKPPIKNKLSKPIDQIFGNITIELKMSDGNSESLKYQALHYSDRNYQPPRNIGLLYESIFEQE